MSKTDAKFYCMFSTAWGQMGAVANKDGLLMGVILPHYQKDDLLAMLAWDYKKAVQDDAPFEKFIAQARRYFNGELPDFSGIEMDMSDAGNFYGKVYRACMTIPFGKTVSYRELAVMIGSEEAARPVATAMSRNPLPLIVPCHRVIHSDGTPGGFSAAGGVNMKLRMIEHEKKLKIRN